MKISTLLLAAALFSGTAATAQGTLSNGLQAYYPFTGNTLDVSGNFRHLFNGGAQPAPDANGTPNSAYYFNGTNSYMQLSTNAGIDFTGDFSVCMKVKPMGYFSGACHGNALMTKGTSHSGFYNIVLIFDDSYYTNNSNCSTPVVDTLHQNFHMDRFHQGTSYSTARVSTPPFATSHVWRSLVLTQKGDTLSQYIDGLLITQVYSVPSTSANNMDIFLGKTDNSSDTYHYKGMMDELRFYNRALTTGEVKDYHFYTPTPVAVMQTNATQTITVTPNPATADLKLTNPSRQLVTYRILNLQGSEVTSGIAAAGGETTVPVSQLAKGLYILHLCQGTTVQVQRFLKE